MNTNNIVHDSWTFKSRNHLARSTITYKIVEPLFKKQVFLPPFPPVNVDLKMFTRLS